MGGFSLHHYVRPQNINELKVIHGEARPSAVFYISTILSLYLLGLLVILVHYMNSCYGAWNWSFGDVWREIRPRTLGSKKSPKDDPESPRSPVSPTAGNGGAANGEHHHEGCPLYRYGAKSQPRNNPARRTTSSSTLSSSSSHKRRNNCDLEAGGGAETPPPPPFSPGANSEDGKLVPRVKEEEEEARVEEELRRIWTRSRRSIIRKWSSLRGKRGEREVFLHPGRNNNINVSQNGHSSANTNSSTGCHSTSNAATNTSHPNNQEQSSQFSMVSNSSGVRRSTSGRVCTCGFTSKRPKRDDDDDEEEDEEEEIVGKVSTVATTTVEIHAGNGSNQV